MNKAVYFIHFIDFENDSQPPRPVSSISTESGDSERAVISSIDSYMELLYDEIPDKIKGSSLILQLARVPDNLQELTKNGNNLTCLKETIFTKFNFFCLYICFRIASQCFSKSFKRRLEEKH